MKIVLVAVLLVAALTGNATATWFHKSRGYTTSSAKSNWFWGGNKVKVLPPPAAVATVTAAPSGAVRTAKSIAEVAGVLKDLSTLLAAVQAAGGDVLATATNPDSVVTVFAPTNKAFEQALESLGLTAEAVLADPELLSAILAYHVVNGAILSKDVKNGDEAATLLGDDEKLTLFKTKWGDISVSGVSNSANIVLADVFAGKSIIHVVDSVLLPPAEYFQTSTAVAEPTAGDMPCGMKDKDTKFSGAPKQWEVAPSRDPDTIAAATAGLDELSTTDTALLISAFEEAVSKSDTAVTVFAPSNDAYTAALSALGMSAVELFENKPLLNTILSYHVVEGKVLSSDLQDGQEVTTLLDPEAKLTVGVDDMGVTLVGDRNSASVITADVEAGKSVVHVVDAVLLPADYFINAALMEGMEASMP